MTFKPFYKLQFMRPNVLYSKLVNQAQSDPHTLEGEVGGSIPTSASCVIEQRHIYYPHPPTGTLSLNKTKTGPKVIKNVHAQLK